jgi:hypothetical protein
MIWRVMAQEVSCLLLTEAARVHSPISSYVMRGAPSGNGAGLLPVLRFFPRILIPPNVPFLSHICCWYNGPFPA